MKTHEGKDWRDANGYYRADEPCCVCGTLWRTGLEPRFCYVVCEEHSKLSPVEVGDHLRKDIPRS